MAVNELVRRCPWHVLRRTVLYVDISDGGYGITIAIVTELPVKSGRSLLVPL